MTPGRCIPNMPDSHSVKVLILFTSGEIGGAERSLTRMAAFRPQPDIDYCVATLGKEGKWSAWAHTLLNNVTVLGEGESGGLADMVKSLQPLARLIKRCQPDIVYMVGLKAAILSRLLKLRFPKILMVNAVRASLSPGTPEGRRYRKTEAILKHITTHYISNSEAGRAALLRFGVPIERTSVIYNGIETAAAEAKTMSHRPLEICFLSNLAERKGHLPFLDVIEKVAQREPSILFRFVGRDEMEGRVQAEARLRGIDHFISFEGFQADPSVFLAQARASVLPAILPEGAPTSILEAFAQSTPVVCFDVGGVRELMRNGVDGWLVPPRDYGKFCERLLHLVENPAEAELMGRAGFNRLQDDFTLSACANKHAYLWRELANRHNAHSSL
jgi:glycosyltransferase involved in cell wall biosynthesis